MRATRCARLAQWHSRGQRDEQRNDISIVPDGSLPPVTFGGPRRGSVLPVLYVSLAGLQAFDGYLTLKGISKGAVESNRPMRGAAGNSAAVWAIKAGVTGATISLAERLWRNDKRAQAIAVMVISNGMMAAVAARNAHVLRQLQ